MAITNGYCSLVEYKSWNTIDTTNTTDDAVIEDIIESISRQIDTFCGRVFYSVSAVARYYTARQSDRLEVNDISTLTGLIVETDLDGDGVFENTWASTDYNVWPYNSINGLPYMRIDKSSQGVNFFSTYPRGNKITAAWGFAAVPDDVKTACLIGVDAEYHARNGQNLSVDTQVSAMGVVMTPRGLPRSVIDKIKTYRNIR